MVLCCCFKSVKVSDILDIVVIKVNQWLFSKVAAQFHQILISLQELACTISTVMRMPSFLLQQFILQGSLMQVMILISSVFNKYGDEEFLHM